MTATYTIYSTKGRYSVSCDTLKQAIQDALRHEAEYQPAYGTSVLNDGDDSDALLFTTHAGADYTFRVPHGKIMLTDSGHWLVVPDSAATEVFGTLEDAIEAHPCLEPAREFFYGNE